MILKGTQIESGSIIGAMSVVSNKKISANSSWAGNPAKKIREGLFWNRPCVHKWTEEQTKDSHHFIKNNFIFKHKKNEYIPFSKIEEKLDAKNSVDSKLEYLGKISADGSKNRFCAGNGKEENASGGFFSRFKK